MGFLTSLSLYSYRFLTAWADPQSLFETLWFFEKTQTSDTQLFKLVLLRRGSRVLFKQFDKMTQT